MVPTKIGLVGDAGVGKTWFLFSIELKHQVVGIILISYLRSMLTVLAQNEFPELVTECENWEGLMTNSNDFYCTPYICDTIAEEKFFEIRTRIVYPHANMFLVAFSCVNSTSLDSVKGKWVPEIRNCCPTRPILLVGTQCDLRGNESYVKTEVAQEVAEEMVAELNLAGYVECSARYGTGVRAVLDKAMAIAKLELPPKKKKEKKN